MTSDAKHLSIDEKYLSIMFLFKLPASAYKMLPFSLEESI